MTTSQKWMQCACVWWFPKNFDFFIKRTERKKSSKWFLSMTRFLFLGDKPWLGLNNMIFICVEKFYVSSLGSTGIAVLREVNYRMKLLLYWTHWKNLDLKSHLDLQVVDIACWLRNIKQNGMKRKNLQVRTLIILNLNLLCWNLLKACKGNSRENNAKQETFCCIFDTDLCVLKYIFIFP